MNQEVYNSKFDHHCDHHEKRWSALDPHSHHPMSHFCNDDDIRIEQEAIQKTSEFQLSEELIYIKDSCEVNVNSVDIKAALSLQAALQAAIAIVISVSILDGDRAEKITQELLQTTKITQITRQKTIIENSRGIDVHTTDGQFAASIQALFQLLVALIVDIDIL
ncbi:spore coat protein [Peribacillus glennii]|uniref:Spore coat protein n=1 Tax=Peribacillus glennii TaxID=2303991 RepID=A0A372LKK6_9BACI|nr:spore coat protein [Peribacillus glennii]RFU66736.1 spore coat protein [Peribacillus glennii]